MIGWDRDWLDSILSTRKLIEETGPKLQSIPDVVEREVVRRQFHILSSRFKGDVTDGYNPNESIRDLMQIAKLIGDLVDGG